MENQYSCVRWNSVCAREELGVVNPFILDKVQHLGRHADIESCRINASPRGALPAPHRRLHAPASRGGRHGREQAYAVLASEQVDLHGAGNRGSEICQARYFRIACLGTCAMGIAASEPIHSGVALSLHGTGSNPQNAVSTILILTAETRIGLRRL